MRRDRQRRQVAARDGVAVGRGFRRNVDAEHAARAGAAVHHHLLAENVAQFLREDARENIGVRAGAVGQDVADGTVGVIARGVGGRGKRGLWR